MPSGGGLDGLFSRLKTGLRPNPLGGTDFYAEQSPVLFDHTGLFTRSLPAVEDIATTCRRSPVGCGTYSLGASGRLTLSEVQDGFGTMQDRQGQAVGGSKVVVIGEDSYSYVPPLAGPLQGTWSSTFAQSGTLATGSSSVHSSRTLTFTRDGRFSRSGSSGFNSSTTTSGGTSEVSAGSQRPDEGGTYSLSPYALTLTHGAGPSESLSLFAPDRGSDNMLVINGDNYLKEGSRPR